MILSSELLALFAAKSKKKKLFFSTWQGRRQMAVRLDDRDEGAQFVREIGGRVAQKTKRPPIGAWEWYYHGRDLLSIAAQLHPILNWYQQQVTAPWVAEQPTLPLDLKPVIKKKLTAKQRYFLDPGDKTWREAWDEQIARAAVSGGLTAAATKAAAAGGDGKMEGGFRTSSVPRPDGGASDR